MHFPFASICRNHAASSCPYIIVCPSIVLLSWRTKCIKMWWTPNVHLIYFTNSILRKIYVVRKQMDKSTKQRVTKIDMFSGECGKKIWISSLARHVFLIPSGNLKVCMGAMNHIVRWFTYVKKYYPIAMSQITRKYPHFCFFVIFHYILIISTWNPIKSPSITIVCKESPLNHY